MSLSSGTSNYPNNFDLFPTSGTPTLVYVIDQERNPITGIIVVSGTQIRGLQVNSTYTILQTIEETLGINPQGIYASVADRFTAIAISGAGAGVFVNVSGDTMTGDLNMFDVDILPTNSGIGNLGSAARPFNTLFVNNISGVSIGVTGAFVHISGDTMTGPLLISGSTLSVGDGVMAIGADSTAFGLNTLAAGDQSHAEGSNTVASGTGAHAEGGNTQALNFFAHAEGSNTIASGTFSHAEGSSTIAGDSGAHAEGNSTRALGSLSHAEGGGTQALGSTSHSEGATTIASGASSHAEGSSNIAYGNSSHVEGSSTIAYGDSSHAEGNQTIADGTYSHVEGLQTFAHNGTGGHAEGIQTISAGNGTHAEGLGTIASGNFSHAQGNATQALGDYSNSGGFNTRAYGQNSFAHGSNAIASGNTSFSLGWGTAQHDYSFVIADPSDAVTSSSVRQMSIQMISGVRFMSGSNGETNLYPEVSGHNFVGTNDLPFSGVHTRTINNNVVTSAVYNEVPSGAIDGSNSTFTLLFAPYNTSIQTFKNGLYMAVSGIGANSIDFVLSGNTMTFIVPPASGSTIISNYVYLI